MIGTLYRYPHPHDPTRFVYVGQGAKRDKDHRRGHKEFGKRFKKRFPDTELPQPIREEVEVKDHLELNELETIWMFRYHTWRGYDDGMNYIFPGSADYKLLGKLGGSIGGKKSAERGHMARMTNLPQTKAAQSAVGKIFGHVQGLKNVENGHFARIKELPQTKKAMSANGRAQGRKNVISGHLLMIGRAQGPKNAPNALRTCCLRWSVRRGKPCICGWHEAA